MQWRELQRHVGPACFGQCHLNTGSARACSACWGGEATARKACRNQFHEDIEDRSWFGFIFQIWPRAWSHFVSVRPGSPSKPGFVGALCFLLLESFVSKQRYWLVQRNRTLFRRIVDKTGLQDSTEIQWDDLLRDWRVTLPGHAVLFTSGCVYPPRDTTPRGAAMVLTTLCLSVCAFQFHCPKHACGQRVASNDSIAKIVARPMKISIEKCEHERWPEDIGTDGTDKLEVLYTSQASLRTKDQQIPFKTDGLKLPIYNCSNCDTKVWWEPSQAILVFQQKCLCL